ncbi:MAG: hypothetical protein MR523_04905 [Lachnospiraceae bacterium]|nr:hypothetical protein [Lachnospiraceae bacterium]
MEYLILAGAMVIFVVLVMGKEYLNSKKYRKKILDKLYQSYGTPAERNYKPGEMDHIMMYYHKHPVPHQIDDITWNDLNMDQIYQTINTSCSAAGDEYLYYRLRTPVYDAGEMEKLEHKIHFFTEHEKERHDVQSAFYSLGRTGKYSIYEYLEYLDDLGERRNFKYVFFDLLLFVCIGLMFLSPIYGIVLLLVVLCHNIIVYFKEYKQIEPYITSFRYVRRLLECVEQIKSMQLPAFSGEQVKLTECYQSLKNFRRSSYLVLSSAKGNSNPLEIVLDYLRMCFSLDLIQFNKALRSVRGHMDEIDEMITLLGQMETAVVIGSYRNSLQDGCCIPVIHYEEQAERKLRIQDVYHPLLTNPVKNSLQAERGVLLTGSNASGKSTFLRTVAISALFAQTIHTCSASYYEAPVFRIYSSMSLKDNLLGGESYYMAEIKSMKRILDQSRIAGKEKIHVLCFVDEVLRGTNTVERIAASTRIMQMFADEQTLCFAATHDVELTKLLVDRYDNYHFEERIEEEDIYFPYRLMTGPATSRNAIALLKMLGYDDRIISGAEEMAENFLKTGKWDRSELSGKV